MRLLLPQLHLARNSQYIEGFILSEILAIDRGLSDIKKQERETASVGLELTSTWECVLNPHI